MHSGAGRKHPTSESAENKCSRVLHINKEFGDRHGLLCKKPMNNPPAAPRQYYAAPRGCRPSPLPPRLAPHGARNRRERLVTGTAGTRSRSFPPSSGNLPFYPTVCDSCSMWDVFTLSVLTGYSQNLGTQILITSVFVAKTRRERPIVKVWNWALLPASTFFSLFVSLSVWSHSRWSKAQDA